MAMKPRAMKKKMMRGGTPTKAGPKGYTKKTRAPMASTKTTRPQSQTSIIKDKINNMSEEQRKKVIMQMLQGKTPKFMEAFKK